MTKRLERVARKVTGDNAGVMTDALNRTGTYHCIGACCCAKTPTAAEFVRSFPAAKFGAVANACETDLRPTVGRLADG